CEPRRFCVIFYGFGMSADIRIPWTHRPATWTIAPMDWRDWELFCEVVQHGGFSAAARVLGHPKSSLSAAVQRLEANLGLRLIERSTRHLRLTDAGDIIYQRVRPLFVALHDTQGFLARTRPVRGACAIGKIRRATHAGRTRAPADADRPPRRALGADHAGRHHRASHGSEGAAGEFERGHPVAGSARRARRVAGDGELYPRGGGRGIVAADPYRSCLRAAQHSRAAAGP